MMVSLLWFESEEKLIEAMSAAQEQKIGIRYSKMRRILSTTPNLLHLLLKSMNFK